MLKVLAISPHLSTGGQPMVLLKRLQLLENDMDFYVVEFNNYGDAYVIQKNQIKKILKPGHFFTLGEDKSEILDIIQRIDPQIVHFEEIPELFNIGYELTKKIYKPDRKYKIFETTHSSDFNVDDKIFLPDKFLFVSQYNCYKFNKFGIPSEVIEYPVEKTPRDAQKKAEALRKLNLDPKTKHVVNVGLFTPRKNQAYAFEMARLLQKDNIQFHFIGNQADNFQDYWKPLMKNKPKNCRVWGERDDIDTFLDACDVFLFTSMGFRWNKELNPLVIKEALEHQIPQFLFPLDVYNRKYDTEDTIHYLNGDADIDATLLKNFLFERKAMPWTDKKFKIRAVHLLLEEDNRKSESIKELEKLPLYGIDYVQHINKRYTETPPKELCARPDRVGKIGSYALRGPHYGNYTSFKKAIFKEFTEDIDFLMIFEADCKLNVSVEEFSKKVFESCEVINKHGIYYMSFGDNRNLRTGEMVSDKIKDTEFDWLYITNKIIGIQSIMFPKFARDFILRAYETIAWDVTDLLYNDMFKSKTKAIAPRLTTQIEGISTIQGEKIEHFKFKNVEDLLRDKNENDILVDFYKDEQRFHFCMSDYYDKDVPDIKIVVDADDNKNVFSTVSNLNPHNTTWIMIYNYQNYKNIYFNFFYKDEFLFRKKLSLNLTAKDIFIQEERDRENKKVVEPIKVEPITPVIKDTTFTEIPQVEQFNLDYKINENRLYLPYSGPNSVTLKVVVKNIETKESIFSVDNMDFANGNSINWIMPKGYNQYETEPEFCGYTVDYIKNDKILFSRELRLRNKKKIENINPTGDKNIYLVLTYPDTETKAYITVQCIEALKKLGKKIILASHYPVIKEIQEMADYYIYDAYNPLIEHTLYTHYWNTIDLGKIDIWLNKLQKKDKLNQSLTVLNNIENAVRFAKHAGYDNLISVSYDFILSEMDVNKIDNICDKMKDENKKGYFMSYGESNMRLYKSVFFITNTDFYTKIFNNPRTPEKFNEECQMLGSHNFLENYYYKKLSPYSNDLIVEDTTEEKLFNTSTINLFSGVEYLTVVPVKDSNPKSFVIWFNSSNNTDDRRIEFTFDNNGVIESSTHFVKSRTYYFKKIILNSGDNYIITAKFIDSKLNKNIDTQVFTVNESNYNDLSINGLFTETGNIKKEDIKKDRDVTKLYTKGLKIFDFSTVDFNGNQNDVGIKYGWEAAMYWANLHHNDMNEHGIGIEKGDVFVDLGANIGMSSIRAELCGASSIYSIEPDPDIFEALQMNAGNNWTLFNIAISKDAGMVEIPKWPDSYDLRPLPSITFDQFVEDNGLQKIDFLKVDIEGYEKTVFWNTKISTWNKIRKIFIEFHENTNLSESERNEERIKFVEYFKQRGFNNSHVAVNYWQSFIYLWKTEMKKVFDKDSLSITFNTDDNKVNIWNSGENFKGKLALLDVDSKMPLHWTNCNMGKNSGYWILPIPKAAFDFVNDPYFNGFDFQIFDENDNFLMNKIIMLKSDPKKLDLPYLKWISPFDCLYFIWRDFFINKIYDEFLSKININVAVDLGANQGLFVHLLLTKGAKKIYAVEAMKSCSDNLRKMFTDDKVVVINKAISNNNDNKTIYFDTIDTTVSHTNMERSLKHAPNANIAYNKSEVECITFNDLIRDNNIEKIDFLKVDIEGDEYILFDSISEEDLSKVDNMLIEYHHNYNNDLDIIINKIKDKFDYKMIETSIPNGGTIMVNKKQI